AGPTGPAGTTGPAGPTGPQGPSGDVWLVKAAAVVLAVYPDEGNAQHVNSVVLPAGTFFLTSTINGYNTIGTARPQCQFVSSDAAIVFGLAAAQTVPPAEEESFTAQALATVDTGPATVSLQCQNLGDSSVGVSADVIAQQVGTIH